MSIAYVEVPVPVVIQACNDYLVALEKHAEAKKNLFLKYEVDRAMKPKFFGLIKPKSREVVEKRVLEDLQSDIWDEYAMVESWYDHKLEMVSTITQMCSVSDVDTIILSEKAYSLIMFYLPHKNYTELHERKVSVL